MYKVNAPTIRDTINPTVNDDITRGMQVGWRWINTSTQDEYICADNDQGAATWNPVGSVAGGVPIYIISPIDWFTVNPVSAPTSIAGDYTVGCAFTPFRSVRVTGIRFYWANAGGQTIDCKIWDDTSAVATIAVVTSGIGYYTGTLVTPYEVPSNKINYKHYASIHDAAGGVYTNVTIANSRVGTDFYVTHALPGIRYDTGSMNSSAAGDARPSTISHPTNRYPVEPIFDYTF